MEWHNNSVENQCALCAGGYQGCVNQLNEHKCEMHFALSW